MPRSKAVCHKGTGENASGDGDDSGVASWAKPKRGLSIKPAAVAPVANNERRVNRWYPFMPCPPLGSPARRTSNYRDTDHVPRGYENDCMMCVERTPPGTTRQDPD